MSKELKRHSVRGVKYNGEEICGGFAYYDADDVDSAIAELKQKLSEKESWVKMLGEGESALSLELEKTKQKLEDVKASHYAEMVDAGMRERRLKRALWIARAERYKMIEFIAREEGNLCNQMSWSQYLRKRTYNQWVDQLLRIANLANKLHNKCRAKAEQYK